MMKFRKENKNYTLPRAFSAIREDRIYDVPLSEIREIWQQRSVYDEVKTAKLASSIRENGLCEPILLLCNENKVKPRLKDGVLRYVFARAGTIVKAFLRNKEYKFPLISGGYRIRAYKMLGFDSIPARFLCEKINFLPDCVKNNKNPEDRALDAYLYRNKASLRRNNRLAAALCSHEFTVDPHYLEDAARLSMLCDAFGCRINHLAAVLTLDKAETERKVSLLMLSDQLRSRIVDADLPVSFAELLLRLPNDPMRTAALDRIVDESMSLPDAGRLVSKMIEEGERSYTQLRQFYCKDPRILVNSVVKAAKSIENSGLDVTYEVKSDDFGSTVTVHVDKPSVKETAIVSRET